MAPSQYKAFNHRITMIIVIIVYAIFICIYSFDWGNSLSFLNNIDITAFYSKYNKIEPNDWPMPAELFPANNDSRHKLIELNISHKHPLFTRVIDQKYAIFCSIGYHPGGTGNALGIYWLARASAFFMNWTFVMNNITNHNIIINKGNIIDTSCSHKREYIQFDKINHERMKWTWFLNMEYNQTLYNTLYIDKIDKELIALKYNYIWQYPLVYEKSENGYDVPYRSWLHLLYYNPWFIPIIQNNTRDAFQRYYEYQTNISQPIYDGYYWIDPYRDTFYKQRISDLQNNDIHIIVIHIRMGDILYHGYRYVLNMKYYQISLKMIFEDRNSNNNNTNDGYYKIRVIAQLSTYNAHSDKDKKAVNMSNKIVYFMVGKIENYIKSEYDIKYSLEIIGNDTIDNDYFEMATAPYLICSPSSLCFHAAIANFYNPKLIIFPQIGAWIHFRDTYLYLTENAASWSSISHHRWINTSSMWIMIERLFDHKLPNDAFFDKYKKWFSSEKDAIKWDCSKTNFEGC